MELFLIIAAIIFFIFGSLLLISPQAVEKISNYTNRVLFTIDEKIHKWRKPIGIVFLVLAVFLWYSALFK